MGDYHDHYLKKDVLLLAGVFEKFIDTCLKFYGLDPCHYFSSPWLNWGAMLKMTSVQLEQISEIEKYLFIENGLRGGISYIAKRYAANDFEKHFFKLMINTVYGKTMENLWKRISDRLVSNAGDFLKFTSRPTYIAYKSFEKDCAVIHKIKPVLILNKPIYVYCLLGLLF